MTGAVRSELARADQRQRTSGSLEVEAGARKDGGPISREGDEEKEQAKQQMETHTNRQQRRHKMMGGNLSKRKRGNNREDQLRAQGSRLRRAAHPS